MNLDSKKKVNFYWEKFQLEGERLRLASSLIDTRYRETRALEPTFRTLSIQEKEELVETISDLQKYLNRQKNYLSKISKELRKN
jgi:hypothetical protein